MYIYVNGKETDSDKFDLIEFLSRACIYEVIRLIDGVPLFWGEHMNRFEKSCKRLSIKTTHTLERIQLDCKFFLKKNDLQTGSLNIYLSVKDHTLILFWSKTSYPSLKEYMDGIKCITLQRERNDPHLKISNTDVRKLANEVLSKNTAYEALLVNENNYYTEGSRSNLFFMRGNCIYTAPDAFVLIGITRSFVIEALKKVGFDIEERLITIEESNSMDAAFITGTSPKILPISSIDDIQYSTSWTKLREAMREFDEIIATNINTHKSAWKTM